MAEVEISLANTISSGKDFDDFGLESAITTWFLNLRITRKNSPAQERFAASAKF